jgi:hypothetical protein
LQLHLAQFHAFVQRQREVGSSTKTVVSRLLCAARKFKMIFCVNLIVKTT